MNHQAVAAEEANAGLAVYRESGGPLWANARFRELVRDAALDASTLADLRAGAAASGLRIRIAARSEDGQTLHVATLDRSPPDTPPGDDRSGQIDATTGVLNRGAIELEIERRFAARASAPFALVFLDLDDFKAVNDERGHLAGDDCLRLVGERLRVAVRAGDVVGRFGGDEFVVLAAGVRTDAELDPITTRLEALLVESGGPLVQAGVGVSIGAALTVDGYSDARSLIHAADQAMYAAKRAKRGAGEAAGA